MEIKSILIKDTTREERIQQQTGILSLKNLCGWYGKEKKAERNFKMNIQIFGTKKCNDTKSGTFFRNAESSISLQSNKC